jgi:peroxiredoxin
MLAKKLAAGAAFPVMSFPDLAGGTLDPSRMSGWRMVVVYRGKHCPLCKTYFKTLDGLLDEYRNAGVAVVAVSADPKEKAAADVAEFGWKFPVGYGLTPDQMRALGPLRL